jgi:hypothetical protein
MSSGSNVNAVTIAINIASPVRSPNRIVGIKFEKTRIENPAMIVSEV